LCISTWDARVSGNRLPLRIPRNYWIAGLIALAVVLWMLSGMLVDDGAAPGSGNADEGATAGGFKVEVAVSETAPIRRRIVAQGQVKPERFATLRAQTAGQVEAVLVKSGQRVREGDLLVRLAMDDREARLEEARALLQQRQREYEAAQRLGESGFQSRVRQDEAAAALASAQAALRRIELDIAHTRITAPFDGIVDQLSLEVGDLAAVQSPVVSVVDNSPLIAEAWLSQRHFSAVRAGGEAVVTLVSGETRTGKIIAVSPRADESSRTFRVEVEVANPDGVPANTSAEIEIPTGSVDAHRLSPALLELDDSGQLGVKIVDEDGRVDFVNVEIVRSDHQGVWVTGLPARARVITAGGGFVSPGRLSRSSPPAPRAEGSGVVKTVISAAFSRSRTVVLMFVFILVAGAVSYLDIAKEAAPDVDIPIINVVMTHEGISPGDAERLLLRPMETQLQSIEGVDEMRSLAAEGYATITLEFGAGFRRRRRADRGARTGGQRPQRPPGRYRRSRGE
jgi:membrane fusion protein, multidrug efflux system